jgi:putative DNA primase/helicase
MPKALHDRACDNWRGLLAIANLAGWDWPLQARAAAQTLSTQGSEQDDQSRGVMLLADIRRVLDDRQKKGGADSTRISSTGLVDALVALGDRPWATWFRGKQISPNAVARLLKDFGIFPNTILLANGKQPNGYKRSQFDDAFARYLPQPSGPPAQGSPSSPTPANSGGSGADQSSPRTASGEDWQWEQSIERNGFGELGELADPRRGQASDPGEDIEAVVLGNLAKRLRTACADG